MLNNSGPINATTSGCNERAKAVGYLAGIALPAIEAGDVAARLEVLESTLKRRPKTERRAA